MSRNSRTEMSENVRSRSLFILGLLISSKLKCFLDDFIIRIFSKDISISERGFCGLELVLRKIWCGMWSSIGCSIGIVKLYVEDDMVYIIRIEIIQHISFSKFLYFQLFCSVLYIFLEVQLERIPLYFRLISKIKILI